MNNNIRYTAIQTIEYGDEIGAFAPDRQLVGSGVYTGNDMAFVIWGLDKQAGLKSREPFEIKVWRASENILCNTKNVVYIEGDNMYRTNKVSIIGSLELDKQLPENKVLIYPNPANNHLIVQSGISIDVSIHDITGRSVYHRHKATSHRIITTQFGNGAYIVVYSNNEKKITGRQIIIINH